MGLPNQPAIELNEELQYWSILFRPTVCERGKWEMWSKVLVSGRRLRCELDLLQQKYLEAQEGTPNLMTGLDRWNLSQTNRVKLNIDNRVLVHLEYNELSCNWVLQELLLIEHKDRGREPGD